MESKVVEYIGAIIPSQHPQKNLEESPPVNIRIRIKRIIVFLPLVTSLELQWL